MGPCDTNILTHREEPMEKILFPFVNTQFINGSEYTVYLLEKICCILIDNKMCKIKFLKESNER